MASHLEKENFGSLMSLLLEKILLDVLFIAFTHPLASPSGSLKENVKITCF